MQIGFIKQILKWPAEFLILTKSHFETSFVIHLYIPLSGLISFLIVKNFANKSHPTVQYSAETCVTILWLILWMIG